MHMYMYFLFQSTMNVLLFICCFRHLAAFRFIGTESLVATGWSCFAVPNLDHWKVWNFYFVYRLQYLFWITTWEKVISSMASEEIFVAAAWYLGKNGWSFMVTKWQVSYWASDSFNYQIFWDDKLQLGIRGWHNLLPKRCRSIPN